LLVVPQEQEMDIRMKNDIKDVDVYVTTLILVSLEQSFTDDEALKLVPQIRKILHFMDVYRFKGRELAKWLWINILL